MEIAQTIGSATLSFVYNFQPSPILSNRVLEQEDFRPNPSPELGLAQGFLVHSGDMHTQYVTNCVHVASEEGVDPCHISLLNLSGNSEQIDVWKKIGDQYEKFTVSPMQYITVSPGQSFCIAFIGAAYVSFVFTGPGKIVLSE